MMRSVPLLATLLLTLHSAESFSPSSFIGNSRSLQLSSRLHALLSLELEKPLGIILEEIEEGGSEGVKVEELADSGSAYASEYRDSLVGLKIATVMNDDVRSKLT